MVDKYWKNVKKDTIVNCFQTCGFSAKKSINKDAREEDEVEVTEPAIPDMNAEWKTVTSHLKTDLAFEEFIRVDEDVAVTGTLTDSDIVASFNNDGNDASDNEEVLEENINVTVKDAKGAINTLRIFLEKTNEVPDSVFSAVVSIENTIDSHVASNQKQSKITQTFLHVNNVHYCVYCL